MTHSKLTIVALGGLGEFGRNMLVFEYEHELIVVDAGLMFPDSEMLGVDVVIPDMRYVFERRDRVRGVIVTHGHEDHIGALPYLLAQVDAPVYATRLTRGLIEGKLREAGIQGADLHTVTPGDVLRLGAFVIELFYMTHSIPDGVGLAIRTPAGLVVHSGDFKFDHTPANGWRSDFAKLASLGGEGVLLLLSDSTNAETPGYTPSERELAEVMGRVFQGAEGRVIVATFASNISRMQQVMDLAAEGDRKVAVVGRSMITNVRIARDLGYLRVHEDLLVTPDYLDRLDPHRAVLLCTGTQGEPTSALVRMARGDHRQLAIQPGDTVIVSATPIPGNEKLVHRTLDDLFRLGADVYYDEVLNVHVSGHGGREEQKLLINLVRPRFFVPIHGDYRHLVLHRNLAVECGIDPARAVIIESGDILELDAQGATVVDRVSDDYVLVDGRSISDVGRHVLAARQRLSTNGAVLVSVLLDKFTGGLLEEPTIETRGFAYECEVPTFLEAARAEVRRAVEQGGSRSELDARLSRVLAKVALATTGRYPMVVATVHKA
ncbi:MAG: ribonuclease J [Anaerolineae bacterium]